MLNEEACIGGILLQLRKQSYEEIEILVADGGSSDATREIVSRHAEDDPRVQLLDNPRRLQSAGLNAALHIAKGDVLVRVDGHSFVERDYVERCVDVLENTAAEVVGGRMLAKPIDERIARGVAIANEAPWGAGPAQFHRDGEAGPVDTVYLGTFVTDRVRELGGWAEDVGVNEDYEMNYRIRAAGGTVWFDPALSVGYQPRRTLHAVAKQYFRYGRSKATVLRRHPSSARARQLIPTLGIPGAIIALMPYERPSQRAIVFLLRLGILGHALAIAFFGIRSSRSSRVGTAAASAAWLMHWTWSAGFWFGVVRPFPSADQYKTLPPRS